MAENSAIDEAMDDITPMMCRDTDDYAEKCAIIREWLEKVANVARREGFAALSTETECRFCCGLHGGAPGSETAIGDTVVCEYCEGLVNDILRSVGHMAEEAP